MKLHNKHKHFSWSKMYVKKLQPDSNYYFNFNFCQRNRNRIPLSFSHNTNAFIYLPLFFLSFKISAYLLKFNALITIIYAFYQIKEKEFTHILPALYATWTRPLFIINFLLNKNLKEIIFNFFLVDLFTIRFLSFILNDFILY